MSELGHMETTLTELNNNAGIKYVSSVPKIVDPEAITCIIEPSENEGGVYLGNLEGASNLDLLRKLKIRAVLTASQETAIRYNEELIHFHEIIQAHDKADYDIVQHFEQAYEFIDRHRKYTSVLVHCFAGISRSASMVAAYLMKKYGISFEKALWNLKSKRRQVHPNVGFIRQLQKYDALLKQPMPTNTPSMRFSVVPQYNQSSRHQQQMSRFESQGDYDYQQYQQHQQYQY